jgi:hypothetical protein
MLETGECLNLVIDSLRGLIFCLEGAISTGSRTADRYRLMKDANLPLFKFIIVMIMKLVSV